MQNEGRQYLDTQEGLARIRGNMKLYRTLLLSFMGKDLLGELTGALEAGDIELGARTAHAIKGTAGNLSMPALFRGATDFERRLKAREYEPAEFEKFKATYLSTTEAAKRAVQRLDDGERL